MVDEVLELGLEVSVIVNGSEETVGGYVAGREVVDDLVAVLEEFAREAGKSSPQKEQRSSIFFL